MLCSTVRAAAGLLTRAIVHGCAALGDVGSTHARPAAAQTSSPGAAQTPMPHANSASPGRSATTQLLCTPGTQQAPAPAAHALRVLAGLALDGQIRGLVLHINAAGRHQSGCALTMSRAQRQRPGPDAEAWQPPASLPAWPRYAWPRHACRLSHAVDTGSPGRQAAGSCQAGAHACPAAGWPHAHLGLGRCSDDAGDLHQLHHAIRLQGRGAAGCEVGPPASGQALSPTTRVWAGSAPSTPDTRTR
jgi:hypothetical protein